MHESRGEGVWNLLTLHSKIIKIRPSLKKLDFHMKLSTITAFFTTGVNRPWGKLLLVKYPKAQMHKRNKLINLHVNLWNTLQYYCIITSLIMNSV